MSNSYAFIRRTIGAAAHGPLIGRSSRGLGAERDRCYNRRVEFLVLGPVEARAGGSAVPLPRRQHRALLAALVVHAGEVVSTDRLVDDLWGDDPPASAVGSLQNAVSQLRKALGSDLVVTKVATPRTVAIGATLRYVITIRNRGPDCASYQVVVCSVPSGRRCTVRCTKVRVRNQRPA